MIPFDEREIIYGVKIKQRKGIIGVFDSFFKEEKFDCIFEIGTGKGALSIYFSNEANKMKSSFVTFDIKDIKDDVKNNIKISNGIFINEDFNDSNLIEESLMGNKKCLILNDGGLKLPGFIKFSKLLKKKDILLTHDYYGNAEPGVGSITDADIKECVNENNLEIIYKDIFLERFLWLCVRCK
jgi:hypothetical protein